MITDVKKRYKFHRLLSRLSCRKRTIPLVKPLKLIENIRTLYPIVFFKGLCYNEPKGEHSFKRGYGRPFCIL